MPPNWSSFDAAQCVRAAFDEATGRFRTDAIATIVVGDISVEIDGIYSALNTTPDNIGLIGHTRAGAPTASDQINRLTSVTNGTIHALDVSLFNSTGTPIDSINPLAVQTFGSTTVTGTVAVTQSTVPWVVSATDFDIRDLLHTQDSVRLGNGTNFLTSTTSGSVIALDVDTKANASSPTVYNINAPVASTEYSFPIPAGTKKFTIKLRPGAAAANVQFSYVLGGSGTTYMKIPFGGVYSESGLNILSPITLYFQTDRAGQILEAVAWS